MFGVCTDIYNKKRLLFYSQMGILEVSEKCNGGFIMKALKTIAKILVALAAVAGVVYVVATYGEKIVAWARKVMSNIFWEDCDDEFCDDVANDVDFAG